LTAGDFSAEGDPEGSAQPDGFVEANPAKEFFIYMLTRDIDLIPAITDLVDNCVDGALRQRHALDFAGLWTRINVPEDGSLFEIQDNCGGISPDLLRRYAFCFGRPAKAPATVNIPHSIGRFGIGMKRAIFKMGNHADVVTTAAEGHSKVVVDVPTWIGQEPWGFPFYDSRPSRPDETLGTEVVITQLHPTVGDAFKVPDFPKRLRDEIARIHAYAIQAGLGVSVNGIAATAEIGRLLNSGEIQPEVRAWTVQVSKTSAPITIRLVAGIADDTDDRYAGWYVYCNGRLVLEHDTSPTTGWGTEGNPRYHPQYLRFRGYAFFESDDPTLMPWKTTKMGVDENAVAFVSARYEMVKMVRSWVDFLNRLDREADLPEEDRVLQRAVSKTDFAVVDNFQKAAEARYPESLPEKPRDPMAKIRYFRPKKMVNALKRVLGVKTNDEVGERTFDHFYSEKEDES
jgi:hypothetical protein